MDDLLVRYRGLDQFGKAYRILFENDPHPAGSVDRVLMASMLRLCDETAPFLYSRFTPNQIAYRAGERPLLDGIVSQFRTRAHDPEQMVAAISRYTSTLKESAPSELNALRFGGTEEEILARGSDWCTDVARVACALYQVAGLPSRLAYLADLEHAYSGHTIVEVLRSDRWGAVDALTDVVYRWEDGLPASVWDLSRNPALLVQHYRDEDTRYTRSGQFGEAAISNYSLGPMEKFNYTVGGVNPYYRSVLGMSDRGWPGGLRWLFGEDGSPATQQESLGTPAQHRAIDEPRI
jgi:hypothetical protein